ncbi:hypothetical protein [Sodalinema gerasimenkoae]|uniref:hypothetical protein n=1 Tax=Sodalinema gerasimenkoae TaxID=2862348 RepID=UPI001CA4955E|nr:hypothetical protein [Sodalinema gerasimenkoae]
MIGTDESRQGSMEVHSNRHQPLSEMEQQALSDLAKRAKKALEDGVISRQERDEIVAAIYADGKVSVEECAIFRSIQEKIWLGEVIIAEQ